MKKYPKVLAWSFSRWNEYKQCPQKTRFKVIDKLKEPSNTHMERGTLLHDQAMRYVRGALPRLPTALKPIEKILKDYKKATAYTEQEWAITKDWTTTSWFGSDVWARAKVDVFDSKGDVLDIGDYKTGRYTPDNPSYHQQLELYGVFSFAMFPTIQKVEAKLYFVDHGITENHVFNKSEEKELRKIWTARVKPMLNDTVYKPTPGPLCRYCHFRKDNGGPCQF